MKEKKGFTLVELLAVIVIIAVLATVATPLVMTVSQKTKQKMFAAKVKMIETAAVMCAEKEGDISGCDSVKDLCDSGYIVQQDEEHGVCQKNPVNGKKMGESGTCNNTSCDCKITLTLSGGRYKADFYSSSTISKAPCKGE